MKCEAVRVSMAICEDLGQGVLAADERVVLGDAPVVAQPQYFPGVTAKALRAEPDQRIVGQDAHIPITDRQVQQAVSAEEDAAAERSSPTRRSAARLPCFGHEDIAHIGERLAIE